MPEEQSPTRGDLLARTAEIVAAQLSNNTTAGGEVPALIQSVFDKLLALTSEDVPAATDLTPAGPIRRSVTDDYLVCLEDGKKLKMLKRYLMANYGMTPEAYRAKWGLKPDYPMVAPSYARKRQELAIKIGLGRKRTPPPQKNARRSRAKSAAP